jgi:hypothetical protein
MISAYLRKISFLQAIVFSGLCIGIADGIAAALSNFLMKGVSPDRVFKFVASGVFGMKAFAGNVEMVAAGLFFHFLIAMSFTAFFFIVASSLKNLLNNVLLAGTGYGCGVWLVMNFMVIPLSNTPPISFQTDSVIVGILVHIFIIGIPIAWLAKQHMGSTNLSA